MNNETKAAAVVGIAAIAAILYLKNQVANAASAALTLANSAGVVAGDAVYDFLNPPDNWTVPKTATDAQLYIVAHPSGFATSEVEKAKQNLTATGLQLPVDQSFTAGWF